MRSKTSFLIAWFIATMTANCCLGHQVQQPWREPAFTKSPNHQEISYTASRRSQAHTPPLTHQKRIRSLFSAISTQRILSVIQHLSSYSTRHYRSEAGDHASLWLADQVESIINTSITGGSGIDLVRHRHAEFAQRTIIATFKATPGKEHLPATIISAHIDSINSESADLPAPGADDNASGISAILEIFRILASNGYTPSRGPVEFHWYAAEEPGELGSQEIAALASTMGKKVGAMISFDSIAYVSRLAEPHIAIFREGGDVKLNEWVFGLVNEYSSIEAKWADVPGKPGNDHVSWTKLGYPSCAVTEGNPMGGGVFPGYMNPNHHTQHDRVKLNEDNGYFSIDHVCRFAEIAIAYVVEQSGWTMDSQRENAQ